jgi:hypothetical protein
MTSRSNTRCARGTNRSGTDGKVRVVTAPTDFYLYFPTESDALAAGSELRARGYDVVVRLGADDRNGSPWHPVSSLATNSIKPGRS